jgi:hypothetical protein
LARTAIRRATPCSQHQERGLQGVLGVVRVAEDLPADAQDHRPVPLHQGREGRLVGVVSPGHESLDELPVGDVADHAELEEGMEPIEGVGSRRSADHSPVSP